MCFCLNWPLKKNFILYIFAYSSIKCIPVVARNGKMHQNKNAKKNERIKRGQMNYGVETQLHDQTCNGFNSFHLFLNCCSLIFIVCGQFFVLFRIRWSVCRSFLTRPLFITCEKAIEIHLNFEKHKTKNNRNMKMNIAIK